MKNVYYLVAIAVAGFFLTFDFSSMNFHMPPQNNLTDGLYASIIVIIIVFVFNRIQQSKPNINGIWHVTEEVSYSTETQDPVRAMFYLYNILQKGNEMNGTFEKTGEESILHGRFDYERKNRILGSFEGHFSDSYFSRRKVHIVTEERGKLRVSRTSITLTNVKSKKMEGVFQSTAADAKGRVIFVKRDLKL